MNDGAKNGTLLDVDDVFKHFGGIQAVDGASFEVPASSITALIGPNGAGKTTLFNVVTGFYKGDRGSVTFDGDDVFRHAPYEIAQRGMVRTFQITKALAAMPVIDNMMLAAPDQPGERFLNLIVRPGAVRAREKEVHEAAMELLDVFNLTKLADSLRRHALGRPAQAAGAGQGADGAAEAAAAGRADGGDQPDARQAAAGPHAAPAQGGGGDLPLHRARHGGGDEPLRPRRGDGRRPGDRRPASRTRCGRTRR